MDDYWTVETRQEGVGYLHRYTGPDQTTLVTVVASIVCKFVMRWMFSERKLKVVVVWFILCAEAQG